jgi:hypothetical protein
MAFCAGSPPDNRLLEKSTPATGAPQPARKAGTFQRLHSTGLFALSCVSTLALIRARDLPLLVTLEGAFCLRMRSHLPNWVPMQSRLTDSLSCMTMRVHIGVG